MKLKYYLPLFFFLFSFTITAQKEANFWFFGENVGLDFTNNPPIAISGSLSTDEGSASISDVDGNLQFYTDGSIVYRRDGAVMTNGAGLRGNSSSTQSAIIVPKPLDDNIYYVFTVGNQTNQPGFGVHFSEVDMSLENGFGSILQTNKNIPLQDAESTREKITSVAGEDCNTFWVITQDTNNFYAYKIDQNGINQTPVISSHAFTDTLRGYLKLSPDGKLLVSASQGDNQTYIYDFNSSTGQVSNERRLNIPTLGYGVEFSRDSKQLFLTTGTFSQIVQQGVRNPPNLATLLKFNLDADNDNIIDDISTINASNSEIYRTTSGYRGALQLAANGRIYYARSRTNFLGVITNPEEPDAANINFIEQGVDLGTRICTEGLPPFIQSFFLPIEIRDEDTNEVVNDQELQYCIGQTKVISPQDISGTGQVYEWTFNNGTSTSTISSSETITDLTLSNISTADAGTYNLKITLTDDCGRLIEYNASFEVDVFEAAAATKPQDLIFCDTDRDGFNQFDLNSEKDGEILNGLDPATFEVLYFSSIADANSGNNALPNPYTNSSAFNSKTIFARVQNRNAEDACFEITDFLLSVTDLPVPTQPSPYRVCDNNASGSDTDGIVESFILNTKDAEIYGSLDPTQYTIFYHTTQAGADTNDTTTLIDKNSNYTVTNSQTVFVRIENVDNTDCSDTSVTLDLIVDPLPVLKPNPVLEQCIAATNNNPTVNLTTAEFSISETPNVTFTYFVDAAGTNQITDPTNYPVQNNTSQSVFVLVTTDQNCTRDLIELTINVATEGNNAYNDLQPPVCDDFLDANGNDTPGSNDDTDNITNFSLDKTAIENGINPPPNTSVLYFETEQDRANTLNQIDITDYRNDITKVNFTQFNGFIQFPIYYKIVSTVNNNCQGLGEFLLQINEVPRTSSNILSPLEECDTGEFDGNFSNGSNANIDLTQKITELFNGTGQDENDFNFFFFKSEAAVMSGDVSNADFIQNPSQFTNDVPPGFTEGDTVTQTIYIRIENQNTGCVNPHTSFNVVIHPLPIVTNIIPPIEVCDAGTKDGDVRNGFAQNINVSQRDADFLNGRNASDFTITYHKTQADLQDLNSSGINKTSYDSDPNRVSVNTTTNSSEETLFVRILNDVTGCVFDQSTVTIIVYPEPNFIIPTNLAYCDNDNDGDDANGIIQTIDLDSKITEVLGANQNPNDFIVTFHRSQADADSGNGILASPYTNSNSTETIFVRIENRNTGCINTDSFFDVIVNPLPNFTVTTPQILCLNDLPLNIFVENAVDVYTYEWEDANGNQLSTDDNVNITSGGVYFVTATTTDGTLCSRVESIEINESNPAILDSSFVTIVDESNNLSNQNSLSISIDVINNSLGLGDYQFAVLNTETNERFPFAGFQEEPLFEDLEGGIYQIIVNDKNGCAPDATLLVSVVQFPKFFTPNGDGRNDTWTIKGANTTFYPNSSINIFNRYGNLVGQVPLDSQGWDGTYQSKNLPSDDYWFKITLVPADSSKPTINKTGNFSLLRRER